MKVLFKVSFIIFLSIYLVSCNSLDDRYSSQNNAETPGVTQLNNIKNFRQLSPSFASAGMPESAEFVLLKQNDYQHIINLIPGDFSEQQQQISALSMSFQQIPVDWHQPKLADFQQFVKLMKIYQQDKVLVHCRLNYRASAFAYLYQTTQLGQDEARAKRQLLSVWQPEGIWLDFIKSVQQHYQSAP